MTKLAVDADTDLRPFIPQLKAAGIEVVLRYLKNLSISEYQALHAAGILVCAIWETTSGRSMQGTDAGTEDGQLAVLALQKLGAPKGAAIYLTSDTDIIPGDNLEAAEAYFVAADAPIVAAGYNAGGYADGTELSRLRSDGLPFCWLAGAMGWSGSREFLANSKPTIVQGIIPRGGSWMGHQWPSIPGLNYDADVVLEEEFGGF